MARTIRGRSDLGQWDLTYGTADPRVAGHVLGYQGYTERLSGPLRWWEVPGSKVPLIIDLGTGFRLLDPHDGSVKAEHGSFVAGFHAGPAVPESDGRACCLQVDFTPIGAHLFLGVPMHELTDLVVDARDVLGAAAIRLAVRLHETPSWHARFRLVDDFIARRIEAARPPSPEVTWAWDRLEDTAGRVEIGALAADLAWSHRRLIARFREHVGVPPKLLARILRFERAVGRIDSGAGLSWTDIALTCGYYHQAHLIRDFRELAGKTPTELALQRTGVNSVQDAEPVFA